MERKVKFAVGEYYHLYSRGVEKRKVFLDTKDHERFIALMYIMNQSNPFHFGNFLKFNKIEEIYNEPRANPLVTILSYTLMSNHFHILVYEHTEGGISKFMMKLLTAYSMYFNTKNERSGPLFVHPFRSQHISDESQYMWIFSYIHLNPLKIVNQNRKNTSDESLKMYKYSSYVDYMKEGDSRPESKILDLFLVPEYVKGKSFYFKDYDKYRGLPSVF